MKASRWPGCATGRSWAASQHYALRALGGQSHEYTWNEFKARKKERFGPLAGAGVMLEPDDHRRAAELAERTWGRASTDSSETVDSYRHNSSPRRRPLPFDSTWRRARRSSLPLPSVGQCLDEHEIVSLRHPELGKSVRPRPPITREGFFPDR